MILIAMHVHTIQQSIFWKENKIYKEEKMSLNNHKWNNGNKSNKFKLMINK